MPDRARRNNGRNPNSQANLAAGGNRGKGRPKGAVNKSSAEARLAIAAFVDRNSARIQEWLDDIYAEKGAQAAWDCFIDLVEYHVPKLARTELTGLNGGAIVVQAQPKDEAL
jgi:hypothetical protein